MGFRPYASLALGLVSEHCRFKSEGYYIPVVQSRFCVLWYITSLRHNSVKKGISKKERKISQMIIEESNQKKLLSVRGRLPAWPPLTCQWSTISMYNNSAPPSHNLAWHKSFIPPSLSQPPSEPDMPLLHIRPPPILLFSQCWSQARSILAVTTHSPH